MAQVSKDIIAIKFKKGMTLGQCVNEFYAVMRKHGIKKGTEVKRNGKRVSVTMNNFDWTIAWTLFRWQLSDSINWNFNLLECPKDLEC